MDKERLQKILAQAGYGSRRTCETFIEAGRVTVDGKIATLGDKANPETQEITLDGTPLRSTRKKIYIMLNKPRGIISTANDPEGRRTVLDLIPIKERLYPVGRLDANSEGLILLTNDGPLTQHLTHPRYEHARTYRVRVKGEVSAATLARWKKGITIEGRYTKFDDVVIEAPPRDSTWLRITIHEGRKHLIRRMVIALGHPPQRLIRVSMGPLQIGTLPTGKWRHLHNHEVQTLAKLMGRASPQRNQRGPRSRSQSRRNQPSSSNRKKR